jgi:DNA-binding NarL/FixJ family response regulator
MRAALRLVLEGAGPWEVIEAVNGEQVLELARTQNFGLIILDLAMPVMDGITTARVLSERYPNVPILMHTLYGSQRVAVEAQKVGVRKVIPKSDKATILNAVRKSSARIRLSHRALRSRWNHRRTKALRVRLRRRFRRHATRITSKVYRILQLLTRPHQKLDSLLSKLAKFWFMVSFAI